MIPRPKTRDGLTGYYVCDGRRYHGTEFCDQPYLRQDTTDKAIWTS